MALPFSVIVLATMAKIARPFVLFPGHNECACAEMLKKGEIRGAEVWRTEWDCWDRPGPRPFGPDAPERASSKNCSRQFCRTR